MRRLLQCLVFGGIFAFLGPAWAGESLVYVVVYKGPDFSAAKTEIYSINLQTTQSKRLFSDEKAAIILPQNLYSFDFPMSGGNKLFAVGCEKSRDGRAMESTKSLYELATDGSNSFRKIVPSSENGPFKGAFINPGGTMIGSVNWQKLHQYIFVNDAESGELLHKVCVDSVFLDCYASSIGWLPGRGRIFFTLEVGDADGASEESYKLPGSYIIDLKDKKVTKLETRASPEKSGQSYVPRLQAVLPTGEMIYYQYKSLFTVKPGKADSFEAETIAFEAVNNLPGYGAGFMVSPSGRYIAATKKLLSAQDTANGIWLKDLKTGQEKTLFIQSSNQFKGPFLGVVGWLDQ